MRQIISYTLYIYILCFGLIPTLQAQQTVEAEQASKAQLYFYRAVLALNQGEKEEALALLRYAHHLAPNDATIAHSLGEQYLERDEARTALPLLTQAYQADSTERDFLQSYVLCLLTINEQESRNTAISSLEGWLRHKPNDEDIQNYLASIYYRTSEFQKSIDLYQRLKAENKGLYGEYSRLSILSTRLYLLMGQEAKAQAELDSLIRAFPYEANAKQRATEILFDYGHYDLGKRYLDMLAQETEISPRDLRSLYIPYYKAINDSLRWEQNLREDLEDLQVSPESKISNWGVYLRNKMHGDTLPEDYNWVYERIASLHPEHSESLLHYAKVLESQGLHDQSIDKLRQLITTAPELAEAWTLLMGQLVGQKQYDELPTIAEQALRHHPKEWRVVYLGIAPLIMTNKDADARRYLKHHLPQLVDAESEAIGLSVLYGILGDLHEHVDKKQTYLYYDKALHYNEYNTDVLNNYAYFLALDRQELAKAERMALKALQIKKNEANLLDTYAWILYLREKYSLADLYVRKAIDETKDEPRATLYDHYGDILLARGKEPEAREAWQKALELYRSELDRERKNKASSRSIKKLQSHIKRLEKRL